MTAYRIEAEAKSSNEGVTVDLRQTSIGADDLPQSVLQYVLRTRERVLLQDAAAASEFADDEYLRRTTRVPCSASRYSSKPGSSGSSISRTT